MCYHVATRTGQTSHPFLKHFPVVTTHKLIPNQRVTLRLNRFILLPANNQIAGHRHIEGLDIPLTKLKKYLSHLGVVMQLSNEVHNFARYCERLLSTVAVSRPLTEEEMRLVEYYCREVLTKVVTLQSNPREISHSRNAHPSPDHSTSS